MSCHLLSFVMNIYETTSGNVINPAKFGYVITLYYKHLIKTKD